MSDDDRSSNQSEGGEVTLYECRRCPGQRFTAAERDIHRQTHAQDGGGRGGRASRGRRSVGPRGREPSPEQSEVTLFREVIMTSSPEDAGDEGEAASPASQGKGKRGRRDKPGPASKKGKKDKKEKERKDRGEKITSSKNYNKNVKATRQKSG